MKSFLSLAHLCFSSILCEKMKSVTLWWFWWFWRWVTDNKGKRDHCVSPALFNNNPFCILPSLPFVFQLFLSVMVGWSSSPSFSLSIHPSPSSPTHLFVFPFLVVVLVCLEMCMKRNKSSSVQSGMKETSFHPNHFPFPLILTRSRAKDAALILLKGVPHIRSPGWFWKKMCLCVNWFNSHTQWRGWETKNVESREMMRDRDDDCYLLHLCRHYHKL